MTLKQFLSKAELSTNIRLTKDNMKNGQYWSGTLDDDEFLEVIRRFENAEVIWYTTCKGWARLGEEVKEPYLEIEIEEDED